MARESSVDEEQPFAPAEAAAASGIDTKGWRLYTASNGVTFKHPPGWSVKPMGAGLVISPPNTDPNSELIIAAAIPDRDTPDLLSVRGRRRIDRLVRQSMPSLRRRGKGQSVTTGVGTGAAFDYEGNGPDGRAAEAKVFAVAHAGWLGSFAVVAEPRRLEQRVDTVEAMFMSLTVTDSQGVQPGEANGVVDARIAGKRFRGESISSGEGVYVNTQLVWAFNPDGTVLYGAQSAMSASGRNRSGVPEWTGTGTTAGNVETGRYSASNGILEIHWSDGRHWRNAYGFEPDGSLVLRNAVTKKLINFYAPVR